MVAVVVGWGCNFCGGRSFGRGFEPATVVNVDLSFCIVLIVNYCGLHRLHRILLWSLSYLSCVVVLSWSLSSSSYIVVVFIFLIVYCCGLCGLEIISRSWTKLVLRSLTLHYSISIKRNRNSIFPNTKWKVILINDNSNCFDLRKHVFGDWKTNHTKCTSLTRIYLCEWIWLFV